MEELERQLVEDIKGELILSRREKQRLSEKLDCLIILLRRAWHGEKASIDKLSEIVGIPSPKIIPSPQEDSMSSALGKEFLQVTSSLLDDQIKEDAKIKKSTKVLRPSSAKGAHSATRLCPSNQHKHHHALSKNRLADQVCTQHDKSLIGLAQTTNTSQNHSQPPSNEWKVELKSGGFEMANLSNILPMFADVNETHEPRPTGNGGEKSRQTVSSMEMKIFEEKCNQLDLFSSKALVGPRKTRPVSAALQRRQDYVRCQGKRKARPQTAKPAFRHVTDSEFETLIHAHHGQQSPPVSSPKNAKDSLSFVSMVNNAEKEPQPAISVNISPKGRVRNKVVTANPKVFPPERDNHALGDVTDALQRVQEMERLFRLNTLKLQQKIGIPDAGCI